MKRAEGCLSSWDFRSRGEKTDHGDHCLDGEDEKEAEIRDPVSQPVLAVRQGQRVLQGFRVVQDLFQEHGFLRQDPWSEESQLVIVLIIETI